MHVAGPDADAAHGCQSLLQRRFIHVCRERGQSAEEVHAMCRLGQAREGSSSGGAGRGSAHRHLFIFSIHPLDQEMMMRPRPPAHPPAILASDSRPSAKCSAKSRM